VSHPAVELTGHAALALDPDLVRAGLRRL